jgi:hypothetical protein
MSRYINAVCASLPAALGPIKKMLSQRKRTGRIEARFKPGDIVVLDNLGADKNAAPSL